LDLVTSIFSDEKISRPRLGIFAFAAQNKNIPAPFKSRRKSKQFDLLRHAHKQKIPVGGFFVYAQSTGLEPATSRVTGECSNQLSYDCINIFSTYPIYQKLKYFSIECVGGWNRTTDLGLMSPTL
jgi:hypothetical protein